MSISQMREAIAKVYEGIRWKARVSKMAENQVIAIYRSFQKSGKFEKKKETVKRQSNSNYQQLTMFDYGYRF